MLRHNTAYEIASLTGISPRGAFYVMGGLWEVTLCLVVAGLVWFEKHSIYRSIALGAMVIGVVEGLQMSVCRALVTDMNKVPLDARICDYLAGFPIGSVITGFTVIFLIWLIGRHAKQQ